MVNEAIKKIEEQQAKFTKKDKQFWVAEQLKDICRSCPEQAELILKDLENKDMSISNAEKKIAEYARNNGGCCPGKESDKILREFYGLAPAEDIPRKSDSGIISLEDFI